MKPDGKTRATGLILSLVIVGVVAAPGLVMAYSLLGGNLGLGTTGNGFQRDFRVYNNSPDAGANNNTTAEAAYPGALGAVLAVWKGAKAWASENPLASKNFDFDFQGTATANNANTNTVGWGSAGCGGSVLAYCETPISDGWRIVMCDNWSWEDGPGAPSGGEDIQGVVTHELGHALGLGHSQSGNCSGSCTTHATMCPVICGNGTDQRTIAADDAAGLEAIYGVKPANKPTITSLSGSFTTGGTLVIGGSNFAGTVNVKFSAGTGQNTGVIPGVVYNVASSMGGTQVSVVIPAAAQDGNVIVWQPGSSLMSNAFPLDVNSIPPPLPTITSFSPSDVNAFHGGTVTVTGTGFTGASTLNIGGIELATPGGFAVVNDTTITFSAPTAPALGSTSATVTTPNGTSLGYAFNYVETTPALLVVPAFTITGSLYTWEWGAGAFDNGAILIATNPTTYDFGTPYQILYFSTLLAVIPANDVGVGTLAVTVPAGLGGLTFYTQVGAVDELTNAFRMTNVASTLIIF
jgi:hypothetical protein